MFKMFAALLCAAMATHGAGAQDDPSPVVFGEGVISGPLHDSAPAFSRDGRTVWFSRGDSGQPSTILVSRLVNGRWSVAEPASFSGHWSDMEPTMSPDGRTLVFISNRPVDGGDTPLDGFFNGRKFVAGGGNLWRVDRVGDAWGAPIHLPAPLNDDSSTFAPSLARDGSLYFMRPDDVTNRFRLYRAQFIDGHFESPRPLPFSDGSSTDVDPAVAADESFIVFGSARAPARSIDLFIAFREPGGWGVPIHMGTRINSAGSDAEARLSPDENTLYFSSDRRSESRADESATWNNGKYNIWQVDLVQWRRAHGRCRTAGPC